MDGAPPAFYRKWSIRRCANQRVTLTWRQRGLSVISAHQFGALTVTQHVLQNTGRLRCGSVVRGALRQVRLLRSDGPGEHSTGDLGQLVLLQVVSLESRSGTEMHGRPATHGCGMSRREAHIWMICDAMPVFGRYRGWLSDSRRSRECTTLRCTEFPLD